MAFDVTGFFTVLGKHVKTVNTLNGYISAIETLKTEIRDKYELEDLHDLYVTMPSLIASFQSAIRTSILAISADFTGKMLSDRDYVVEQLDYYGTSTSDVLNALHDYMVDNSESLTPSVVSLGGADVDKQKAGVAGTSFARMIACRTLDGVSSPGNGVSANSRYLGLESQLARSTTVTGQITSADTIETETIQLYPSSNIETGPWLVQDEEPAIGPAFTNMLTTRVGLTNADLADFTSDSPDNWSMTGGSAPTNWQQKVNATSVGEGVTSGLRVNTTGVEAKQKVTGLVANTMYNFSVLFQAISTDPSNSLDLVAALETNGGTVLVSLGTLTQDDIGSTSVDTDNSEILYNFFYLADTVDLDDVYLTLTVNNFSISSGSIYGTIYQPAIAPVTYWNGIGWQYYNPLQKVTNGKKASMAVANNDAGVFQSYFRKIYNVQLPTSGSATQADSLAT